MKISPILAILLALISLSLPACDRMRAGEDEQSHQEHPKIVVTSPEAKDMVITQQYVCQIHSRRHIEVRALQEGYLEEIPVKEGQEVKQGEVMFKIVPVLYKARLDAEKAEAQLAQIEFVNTKKLAGGDRPAVSQTEVALYEAKLAKAEAKVKLAQAEFNFTIVRAPFDGIMDRLHQQQGSLVKKEEILTTLSDNSVMWVYFNVPEARYLEYMAGVGQHKAKDKDDDDGDDDDDDDDGDDDDDDDDDKDKVAALRWARDQGEDDDADDKDKGRESQQIELVLANGSKFQYTGTIGAIEAKFNNETGNIPFRADFPNPNRLLRHGQTGNVLIHRTLKNALVIPQRATFEILDKVYVWVVGEDDVVHQRVITIQHELDDIFVIEKGLEVNDKIILEGVRQVHDGDKVEFEFRKPEEALANQKNHAE